MAWPLEGDAGWEAFGTPITTAPIRYDLPAPVKGYYYDPARLRGVGTVQEAVVLLFNGSTLVVRRRVATVEAEFITTRVWGDALLDLLVVPEFQPCSLVLDVYEDDRETIRWSVGSAATHATPYLTQPDRYAEQEIDIASGSATLGTVGVTVIDPARIPGDQDSGWLTAKLAELGLADLAGRRCRLRRFLDADLGEQVVADGPAGTPTLESSYAGFTWDIRDTRESERKLRAFDGGGGVEGPGGAFDPTGATTLLPTAVVGGYGYDPDLMTYLVNPAAPLLGRFHKGESMIPYDNMGIVNLQFTPGNSTALRVITRAAAEAMVGQVTLGAMLSLGGDDWERPYRVTFKNLNLFWRAQGSSDPWNVINSGTLVVDGLETDIGGSASGRWESLVLTNPYPDLDNETARETTSILFGDSRGLDFVPDEEQDIELMVVYRGPPSNDLPVYVEGLTAGEFARNCYDGIYSPRDINGEVQASGIRYDPATLLLLTDLVRIRLTEVIKDTRDWLEKYIYAPLGWAPALDNAGRVSPVSQVAPTSALGLPAVNDAVTEPSSDWSAGERIINVIRYLYPRDYIPGNPANAQTGDGLAARDVTVEFRDEPSITRYGEQPLEIKGDAFRAVGLPDGSPISAGITEETGYQLAYLRRTHLLNRYSYGAQAMHLTVLRSALPLARPGSWVLLDLSWFPDYVTGRRGLLALAQIIALGDLDCSWRGILVEQVVPILEAGSGS